MLKHFNKNCRNNRNISIFTSISYHSVFTRPPFLFFQHNQQYDTLFPITPCTHKLKAGIAYWITFYHPFLRIREIVVVTRSLVGCRTFLYFSILGLHFVRFQIFGFTAESFQDKRQDIRFTKQISVTGISNLPSKFHVLLIF
jgi:hypothetical protein